MKIVHSSKIDKNFHKNGRGELPGEKRGANCLQGQVFSKYLYAYTSVTTSGQNCVRVIVICNFCWSLFVKCCNHSFDFFFFKLFPLRYLMYFLVPYHGTKLILAQKKERIFIVSPKSGDTMDHAQSSSAEIFLCSTYKPHFVWDFL